MSLGTGTPTEVGWGGPWADAASRRRGKRRREMEGDGGGEDGRCPAVAMGAAAGTAASEPRAGGKEVENNRGEQGRRPWPGCVGGAAQHVPPLPRSPPVASPGGGGLWAPRLPQGPGSSCHPSETLLGSGRGWWPFGVSWGRFPHRETFIARLYHRASKARGPQAMVSEERRHMACLLLVKLVDAPCPQDLSLPLCQISLKLINGFEYYEGRR